MNRIGFRFLFVGLLSCLCLPALAVGQEAKAPIIIKNAQQISQTHFLVDPKTGPCILNAWGATAVPVTVAGMYLALRNGVIEALMHNWAAAPRWKTYDMVDHVAVTHTNRDHLDHFSPDQPVSAELHGEEINDSLRFFKFFLPLAACLS